MSVFECKQFTVDDGDCAMKVGTDSMLLGAWADTAQATRVLDMGAGSGVLSLMVAQRSPQALITAVERDPRAAAAAAANFERSPWADRLVPVCADIFAIDGQGMAPDLIISNPPYFSQGIESPDARRAAARHSSGELGPVTAVELSAAWLSERGSLAMVTPVDFDDEITYTATLHRLNIWRKCTVYTVAGRPPTRILWQMTRRTDLRYTPSEITVRERGTVTDQYKALTRDYYLHY